MTTDSSKPLDGVEPKSISPEDIDEAEVRAALASADPMAKQRGVDVCETLAEASVDAVRPFLDAVAALADDDNAAIALRAIATLDEVAGSEPEALEGRLTDLVAATDDDIVDVQLTVATVLGKLVVGRPDLVAPYAGQLIEAIRVTEPDPEPEGYGDLVEDEVTQRTIEEHVEGERKRRTSGRRTLINVVVAVTEEEPEPAFDAVGNLVALLDDVDPGVAGGAVDALGQLAAADPEVVAPVSARLVDCLDHDRTVMRARAIRALGHLGDDAAVPELRSVAEGDADEDVRELAAETADFLADAS